MLVAAVGLFWIATSTAGAAPLQVGMPDAITQELWDRGDAVGALEHGLDRVRQASEQHGWNHAATLKELRGLGMTLTRAFLRQRAAQVFHAVHALEQQAGGVDPHARAETLYWLGVVTRPVPYDADRFAQSQAFQDQARELVGTIDSELAAAILQQEANLHRALGERKLAMRLYRDALAMRQRVSGSKSSSTLECEFWLANNIAASRDFDAAQLRFQSVLDRLIELGRPDGPLAIACTDNLLRLRGVPPTLDEAEALTTSTSSLLGRRLHRYGRRSETVIRATVLPRSEGYSAPRAWRLWEAGYGLPEEEAFQLSMLSRNDAVGSRLRADVLTREQQLERTPSEPVVPQLESLISLLESELALSRHERALLGDPADFRDQDFAALQSALRKDSALVGFARRSGAWAHTSQAWAYVVRPSGPVQTVLVDDDGSMRKHWDDYTEGLKRAAAWPLRLPEDPELDRLAAELGARFQDRLSPLLHDVRSLIVSAPGGLFGFGMEGFILPGGESLADRFDVSYTCSARAFVLQRDESARRGWTGRAVVAGLPGDDTLPYAGREVDRVRTILAGTNLQSDPIELPRLSSTDVRDASVVHLATHAVFDIFFRGESFLVTETDDGGMTQGKITARGVELGWDLRGQLVVLSACQTGGRTLASPNSLGMYQSLLRAGAVSVVVSSWKVDDAATYLLMERFYQNLVEIGAPQDKARALNEAKRFVRDHVAADGSRPFAHPVYWTGFVLIGDPY